MAGGAGGGGNTKRRFFSSLFRKHPPQQDERSQLPTRKSTTVEIPFSLEISNEQYEQNLHILRDDEV